MFYIYFKIWIVTSDYWDGFGQTWSSVSDFKHCRVCIKAVFKAWSRQITSHFVGGKFLIFLPNCICIISNLWLIILFESSLNYLGKKKHYFSYRCNTDVFPTVVNYHFYILLNYFLLNLYKANFNDFLCITLFTHEYNWTPNILLIEIKLLISKITLVLC